MCALLGVAGGFRWADVEVEVNGKGEAKLERVELSDLEAPDGRPVFFQRRAGRQDCQSVSWLIDFMHLAAAGHHAKDSTEKLTTVCCGSWKPLLDTSQRVRRDLPLRWRHIRGSGLDTGDSPAPKNEHPARLEDWLGE